MVSLTKEDIKGWFKSLQDQICVRLEMLDGVGKFREDLWERDQGGGGRTRIFNGQHIVKGGVNFSAVHGPMPEKISAGLGIEKTDFFATGVSIVLHSKNPFVPIIHMNVRYFETANGPWWFGGGIDLTPIYIDLGEAAFLHQVLQSACDRHAPDHYTKFKKWADDYFFLKHRNETRGVGGIFFDRLSADTDTRENHFEFVKDIGNSFIKIYEPLFTKNYLRPFEQSHLDWQALRRSRYVEFNLVWDRGTKFGLDTNGRTESILMSMPPMAKWEYDHKPEENSQEQKTLNLLKKNIDFINYREV